jgi:hypothetical protein
MNEVESSCPLSIIRITPPCSATNSRGSPLGAVRKIGSLNPVAMATHSTSALPSPAGGGPAGSLLQAVAKKNRDRREGERQTFMRHRAVLDTGRYLFVEVTVCTKIGSSSGTA